MAMAQSDWFLQLVLNSFFNTQLVGQTVRLFTNNITPAIGTSLGAFTEATFPGYAPQVIGTWASAVLIGGIYRIVAPLITFTDTGAGPDNVYGYYVTDSTPTNWYFAELAPGAPIVMGPTLPLLGLIPQFEYTDIP